MASSRKRLIALAALTGVAVVGVSLWMLRGSGQKTADGVPQAKAAPLPANPLPATPAPPQETTVLPMAKELSAVLNQSDGSVEEDLQNVGQLLYFYRQGFGENPVGQNEDIVSALLGENSKRAAYLVENSPSIVDGKLVDRWGSPYWFHPVSGREMEIRSAGPDRELFTPDDVFLP